MNSLSKYSGHFQALLRVVAGLLFLEHGMMKIFGFPAAMGNGHLAPLMLAAGLIELVAGILITIGFFSRYAAFIASGEMAAAYFMAHFPRSFFPALNGGDAAILFCFIFLFIAAAGPGLYSINEK